MDDIMNLPWLSIIVFAPLAAAMLMLFVPGDSKGTTRILAVAAKLLEKKGAGRVLISVCTAGGMGVTAILER